MGALLTAFQGRLSLQRRVDLTNTDVEGATTENTTISGYAETDTVNTFPTLTGLTFDTTDARHIAVGVDGMIYFLYKYRGLPLSKPGESAWQIWKQGCDAILHTTGSLAWQSPLTDSTLTPSGDPAGTIRPYFDREELADMIPGAPGGFADYPPYAYPGS